MTDMYKRLWIISGIVIGAVCVLAALGFHSIGLHAEGLQAKRYADFADVAEQIRLDIQLKYNEFIKLEQKRPYTDYQYYYVPQASNDQRAIVRSPLAGKLEHGLAYGHFQIEPDGTIITPFYNPNESQTPNRKAEAYIAQIKTNLPTMLNGDASASGGIYVKKISLTAKPKEDKYEDKKLSEKLLFSKSIAKSKSKRSSGRQIRQANYQIEPSKEQQQLQVVAQPRGNVDDNIANTFAPAQEMAQRDEQSVRMGRFRQALSQAKKPATEMPAMMSGISGGIAGDMKTRTDSAGKPEAEQTGSDTQTTASPAPSSKLIDQRADTGQNFRDQSGRFLYEEDKQNTQTQFGLDQSDMVQVRIEPFTSVVLPGSDGGEIFDSTVFLIRHIQIEQRHFLQGFKLDTDRLAAMVADSASRLLRDGMGFDFSREVSNEAAHAAVLDFRFGQIVMNLLELEPGWINRQISTLRNWYLAIVSVVLLASMTALASLRRNIAAQIKLAHRKDDFISAVSHELRTPLTTIRMYTEMLEKDWVSTETKRREYYTGMRQESERLSRLVENVLDFSRIQRGRKRYAFKLGEINSCLSEVVDMMAPYAHQTGFILEKDFSKIEQTVFDSDAIMQIAINLIDNAIKYAKDAADKTVTIRTRTTGRFVLIEVQDHGPGVPHLQRKKVFDEFYRLGDESTREAAGTGLGLALVKKFAEAHNGFVEILSVKPTGAVFRVAIAAKR